MDTTWINRSISVIVYSFQNKNLLSSVENILNNSSGLNRIFVYVIDQNNIDREELFSDKFDYNVKYLYVSWDNVASPVSYKEEMAQKAKSEFILHIGDGVSLCKDWDKEVLSSFTKDNMIFSGNNIPKLTIKNNYFLSTEKIESNSVFQKTYKIDRNFIFGKKESLLEIGYPSYLKYYGEQEEHTSMAYRKNYEIYAVPESIYEDTTAYMDELEYVPFSLTHNYNLFIQKSGDAINSFLKKIPEKYIDQNVVLKKIPFENNDIEYNQDKSKIDKIGGNRYLNKIKEIN